LRHFGFALPQALILQSHDLFKFCPKCATPLVVKIQMSEERPTCPNCGWIHYEDPKVAAGVLVLRGNHVLLVRRVMEPFIRQWSIPAGFVNAHEDAREAAVRECLEETGLTVRIIDLFDVLYGREHPRGADLLLVYRAEVLAGSLSAADDADEAGWFPLESLPPLAFVSTQNIFSKYSTNPE
jgi:8-oxo-dGTP diphosphatase